MIRILIADDHAIFRLGVRGLLAERPGWQVVGEAVSGRQAVDMALQLRPDIVVIDIEMPDIDGLEATRRIRQILPHCEVAVLTAHHSEALVTEVLSAGARAFVLKSEASTELVRALEALLRGEPHLSGAAAEYLLRKHRGDIREVEKDLLTGREKEIVRLVAEGGSSKEIATLLGISIKTVETHRSRVMHKLQIHSVADLVRYAMRHGLIPGA